MSLSNQLEEAMKGPTLAQAKAAVKKYAGKWPQDKIEYGQGMVAIWVDEEDLDQDEAEKIAGKISDALPGSHVTSGGNKFIVKFKSSQHYAR